MYLYPKYFIAPLAKKYKFRRFCEVGASEGTTTKKLLRLPFETYTVVDPCFDRDLIGEFSNDPRVDVRKSLSLEALPHLEHEYDGILLDGDHNWYTVIEELRAIRDHGLLRPGGYIFLHDVDWPYGRRDMYYVPDTVPAEARQPLSMKGIVRGQSPLAEQGGFNSNYYNAEHEGGPRNGVLTGVEDFMAENPGKYRFCRTRWNFGLGILQRKSSGPTEALAFLWLRLQVLFFDLCVARFQMWRDEFSAWRHRSPEPAPAGVKTQK